MPPSVRRCASSRRSALLTVARGSSDHAAHYLAYLVMARLGQLVTSLPMSLITLYQSKIAAEGLTSFAFSQSGQSPDLVAPTKFFRDGGARTVAFVNAEGSPLAEAAQYVFPLHAGPEQSVAATKSYIAQLVAGARVVAAWQRGPRSAGRSADPAAGSGTGSQAGLEHRRRRAEERRPPVRHRPRHRRCRSRWKRR